MVQPPMGCAGAGSYISMAQMTVIKACKLLTPHLEAAEWAVGCVPGPPAGRAALLDSCPSLWAQNLSLPSTGTAWRSIHLGGKKTERCVPVSSLGEVRRAPTGWLSSSATLARSAPHTRQPRTETCTRTQMDKLLLAFSASNCTTSEIKAAF